MTATGDLPTSIEINQQKYRELQVRLRQVLSPESVSQYTIPEHQEILTELYRESERLAEEFRRLTRKQARANKVSK